MRFKVIVGGVCLALACSVSAGSIQAQGDVKKDREKLMEGFGDASKALRGQVADPSTLPQVATAAKDIQKKAGTIPSFFPAGSEGGDALPAIWQYKTDFAAKAANLGRLAGALSVAAESGNQPATTAAFAAMGRDGCGSCHQTYRKPQT